MNFRYDIAVSFAGEDRSVVEEFVNALTANDISVFYDSWEQAQLWGKDLYQHFDMIYRQAAQYCVIFISENYVKKAWTKHELRSAQARAFQQNSEYILPIKLDDTELPGLPSTIAYIDLRHTSIKEVVNTLSEKIRVAKQPNIAEISKLITSGNADDRFVALSQIAVFRLKDLLEVTIDIMLNDLSSTVRERAAWALDNLNDERAFTASRTITGIIMHPTPPRARGTGWWEPARFQALFLASSCFRQSGVTSSLPAGSSLSRSPAGNAHR